MVFKNALTIKIFLNLGLSIKNELNFNSVIKAEQYYRTRSNYPNILIARTARLLILFPSRFVEHAEFVVSYPFYLTERPLPATRCNVNLLNYGRSSRVRLRVQLHCSYPRLSISSLTVKDAEVQITVGEFSLQRKTSTAVSSYSSPSLSNYTRTSRCEDLFAFYSMPNDCINNYF